MAKVLILGSGVIGVTAAYYLNQAGHDVEVMDRQPGPALETSFGNAGEVSPGYSSPWAGPGVPVKAIKWLLMHFGPLVIRPKVDPAMITWCLQMLRNCTEARYAINKKRMVPIAEYSRDCLKQLRADIGIQYDEREQGTLQLFRTQAQVDHTGGDIEVLLASYDAIVLAAGATAWRDLPVPGRELQGIHQAMEYLPLATKVQLGDMEQSPIDVAGKHVVIIGGGDTGADCLGTAHRQGAASVTQLEIMPRPPDTRAPGNPWPTFAFTYKVTSAHEEGGERLYSVNTERFLDDGNGNVRALLIHEVQMVNGKFEKVEGSDRELPADFVFLAMGFVGPEKGHWLEQLGVAFDARGNIARGDDFQTNVPGVFVAGDMGRGQSLIVWAIAEGRSCASHVDRWLMGDSSLPAPIAPTARPLV